MAITIKYNAFSYILDCKRYEPASIAIPNRQARIVEQRIKGLDMGANKLIQDAVSRAVFWGVPESIFALQGVEGRLFVGVLSAIGHCSRGIRPIYISISAIDFQKFARVRDESCVRVNYHHRPR